MPQETLQKVYNDYQAKFEVPPFEDFQKLMADPEKRKVVYQDLSSAYEMPSFEDFDKQVNPGTGYPFVGPKLLGAALTGFGQSNIGAEVAKLRGSNIQEMSQFQPSSLSERIAMSAGRLAGDLPSMFAGGLLGTVGGLATGPGAVLSGGAGAFALPRTIEAAQRGETFQEALPEVGKSAALGAGTALTGGIVGKLAPILKVPAEIGALTFGGAGLEGRLPTSDDLIEATALVYGLKFSSSIAKKIRVARGKAENQLKSVKDPKELQLKIDEQLQSIQDVISQEIAKKAPTEPEWQIPLEQQAIKQKMLLDAAQDRMLRRSQRGAELLKKDLSAKEISGEPGVAPDVSAETLARMKETPEQLRQERIESDEIEAAISREKRQQRLEAETEPLTPVRGTGGKFERRPTDVSSLKEAMMAAAKKSQQAEGLPEALKQTLKGLSELFKPGGELRSGIGFSEEALRNSWNHFKMAGKSLTEFYDTVVSNVKGIEPYLNRFVDSVELTPPSRYTDESTVYHGTNSAVIPGIYSRKGFVSEGRSNTTRDLSLALSYAKDKSLKADKRVLVVETPNRVGLIPPEEVKVHEFDRDLKYKSSYSLSQEAPKQGITEAITESLKGLNELFKPGGELRTGVGFSEESYQKAKPHFQKAWNISKDSGYKLSNSLRSLYNDFGESIVPYANKFLKEKNNSISRLTVPVDKITNPTDLPEAPVDGSPSGLRPALIINGKLLVGNKADRFHEDMIKRYNLPEDTLDGVNRRRAVYVNSDSKIYTLSEVSAYLDGLDYRDFEPIKSRTPIMEAISEATKGLAELLKPGGELRSGIGFSEEAYQKAKPHFQKAWEAYKSAGRDFREFASEMLEKGGENLKPFLDQFQREQAASARQNLTQQTTEKVNQASQSKPEERTPGVEDISWLSRIVFTPQRAVSTKLRSGLGKTNIEVNLEHPKAQDITAKVLREDSKTSQTIQNEITHTTNTETDFYKGISRLPQGLSSRVYSAERGVAGAWLKKVINNPANLAKVPQQYKKTVVSLLAHYKLTDAQVKGDPARGIPSYSELMEQAGASKAQINAGLKKLQLADIRFRAGSNVFKDFKSYLSFITRHLSMDPVQVQIKRYMKENPELFPGQIKQTIEEQLLVARGEKSWVEDRVVDGIWKWFGRESYKGFTSFSQLSRRGQANVKLGYRPVSAFVDLAHSVANAMIKREGQPFWQSLKRTADFMKSKEGRKFIKDEEEAGSLQIGLDVDYAGRPVPKEALWKPLGLRSASEVGQRQFALSFAYQNALARGMPEPVAREYARRMLHLTQGTYVLSGMRHFMRAPLAKTVFQFKEYIGRTLELMHTFSGREWAEYAIFNLAMSGPRGLVLFAKSIPMLALVGVLDKVEEALNTYKGIGKELVSGLPGAAGADVAAQATLQIAPQPEDAGGVLISDAIKVFKNFILPVLGPGRYLTARAIKEFGVDTLRSVIPEFRNLMDVWDSIVTQDGWVHNNEGKPVYQLNSGWERVLKTLGASTIEENQLRVAERLRVGFEEKQRNSIKFLLRVAAKDKLTGEDAAEAIQELGKLGIQSQSIENAFKQRLLDPKTRALLRSRLSQKARVLEFYEFE